MKRTIIIIVAFLIASNGIASKNKNSWQSIASEIIDAYIVNQSSQSTELIRIYKNNVYEHIKYTQKWYRTYAERQLGTYTLSKNKIIFAKPTKKTFNGKFVFKSYSYKQQKIYANAFDMQFRPKKTAYPRTKNHNYLKPFYLCIESDQLIYNEEAPDSLDLKELVNYLVKDAKNEQEKANALIKFICGAIDYDRDGYKSRNYAHNQYDIHRILTGEKRVAVCAGYANMFARFCEIGGLKGGEVIGYTKYDIIDLMRLGGYHAWNWIEINGKKQLLDVTWADDGKNIIEHRWINVDPQIMLGTHLPDSVKYQFVENPITREEFLNAPIIIPLAAGVKAIDLDINAYTMAHQSYKIAIPGTHNISCNLYPENSIYPIYSHEPNKDGSSAIRFSGKTFHKNDSTYLSIDLEQEINPISITINHEITLKFVLVKNGVNGLMSYYIRNANVEHAIPFAMGIAAAIKTKDSSALKKLVGEKHEQFFDKNGMLKLNPDLILACSNWMGETSELTKIHYTSSHYNNGKKIVEKEEIQHVVFFGNKVRLNLDFDGVKYALKSYELINPKNTWYF